MKITDGPVKRKINVVKGVTIFLNQAMYNESAVIQMGTTGTSVFVISGATCHLILSLPVNIPFNLPSGERLLKLQDNIWIIKVIIIYEVSF